MRSELIIKSRSLGGSSDLTLLAPIKSGLIPSLEAVTYKTRIKQVLKTLNAGRSSSHEYSMLRVFSDSVDRVARIHSVRVAVVEPDRLLLSVNFDGGWESYLRILWQKVGILLDVIFCNTEGYVSAWGHTYDEWADWVRKVQIETNFFYGTPGLTVEDVRYLRDEEFIYRRNPVGCVADLEATRLAVKSTEELTWQLFAPKKGGLYKEGVITEVARQGLRALALIYRLAGVYLPGTADGDFLHRAARDILLEFVQLHEGRRLDSVIRTIENRFAEQIDWLLKMVPARKVPDPPTKTPPPDDPAEVQAGIISAYPENITHGCLLLVAFKSRLGAASFLAALSELVTRDGKTPAEDEPTVNVAFTLEGLRAIGLSESQIAVFPEEFRQGMEARASVLGDVRMNHPLRWRLPRRNWGGADPETAPAVELSSVHAFVQLRVAVGPASTGETLDPNDPLHGYVSKLVNGQDKVELLSVQPMQRLFKDFNGERKSCEHFGFADGMSNPVLDPRENGKVYTRNQVQLGEFLWGYPNEAESPQDPDFAPDPEIARERRAWLHNGSFLVIRKLHQDVEALNKAIADAIEKDKKERGATQLDEKLVLAKMMGRWQDGTALAAGLGQGNDFNYADEEPPVNLPRGSLCPFHAHVRRANPRHVDAKKGPLTPPPGRRTPRIMRRGMSYGPAYDPKNPQSAEQARGMVFMAYNSSIAEQFEVIQGWISGGNSAGGYSGQSDPFLGGASIGQRKYFRFEYNGQPYRIALDGADDPEKPLAPFRPFVRLEWGAYLFVPSFKVLARMAEVARQAADAPEQAVWSVPDGWRRIQDLIELERTQGADRARQAWKAMLEDPDAQRNFESAGVWAAIRQHCGGVLRTPYGVIVANHDYVGQVLANRDRTYSMCGHNDRMKQSIGEIYLGLDDHGEGCPYREQSTVINQAILDLDKEETFTHAHEAAAKKLQDMIAKEKAIAETMADLRWELNLDLKEVVDAAFEVLCRKWFGLPDKPCEIQPGGARWDWKYGDPPYYPGHFTAPSRYIFQPWPGDSVEAYGKLYGQALRRAFADLITRHRDDPAKAPVLNPDAQLAKAILGAFPRKDDGQHALADDLAARNMVGALMGFIPTVDGNLRLSLNEGLSDGSFWSLRTALAKCDTANPFNNAKDLIEPWLRRAMQLRPAPELIWRTATRHGTIGEEPVRPGDKVVLALVSATHQCLEWEKPGAETEVYPVFGGNRLQDEHPTHACPGYKAAMGAMLGIISAVLEVKEAMRPSVAPLALTMEGYVEPADKEVKSKPDLRLFAFTMDGDQTVGEPGQPAGATALNQIGVGHTIVATGDSWMCWQKKVRTGAFQDIPEYLQDYGFAIERIEPELGRRLYDFYSDFDRKNDRLYCDPAGKGSSLLERLIQGVGALQGNAKPAAIILSAAGNDVVEKRLTPLLKTAPGGLDGEKVGKVVDGLLRCWLELVLDKILAGCQSAPGVPIPIFIHGYAYPVPDGRYAYGGIGGDNGREDESWLYPSFKDKSYVMQAGYPGQTCIDIMKSLIDRLNEMQMRVAAMARFKDHVFHVDLTKELSNAKANYEVYWANELHPTEKGFRLLAKKFAEDLTKNIPALNERAKKLGLL